ncbi:MAG: peptide chain release factor 2 [Alphaproteobacteria bacterium]|nr:peptide chain release factor 2 [Alphaproteobacteria bacterium]
MKAETSSLIEQIRQALALVRRRLDIDASNIRLEELEQHVQDPHLWDNPENAQALMKEREQLKVTLDRFFVLEDQLKDNLEFIEMGELENDEDIILEAESQIAELAKKVERIRLESLLSGEADNNDCYVEIHAGAGGTEAQDWAEILMRMYVRWAEAHNYKLEWLEESGGEEAGIKSATFKVIGHQAYGWLKTESGVHRLVRISPFDSASRRHTSFASVGVFPVIDDNIDIVIDPSEIRVDTYRASGAGGQHVNKTDSAVRMTHIPTNIVVQCQNDRSQHRNRATAMNMLKARLYEYEMRKRQEQQDALNAAKTEIGWGHQIRSYVLHPYQMVKDLRTGVEKGNAQGVLDGDLDEYLEAALSAGVSG